MTKEEIIQEMLTRSAKARKQMERFRFMQEESEAEGDEINASFYGVKAEKYAAVWCELHEIREMLEGME